MHVTVVPGEEPSTEAKLTVLDALRRWHAAGQPKMIVRLVGRHEELDGLNAVVAQDPVLLHMLNKRFWKLDHASPPTRERRYRSVARR